MADDAVLAIGSMQVIPVRDGVGRVTPAQLFAAGGAAPGSDAGWDRPEHRQFLDAEGRPFAVLAVVLDITERRRQEAERSRPAPTQAQRDAARARGVWSKVEEAGRRAREQDAQEAARRQQVERAPRQSQGPSLGM